MKTKLYNRIVENLNTKIWFTEMLVTGQENDGDAENANNTRFILQGLSEALEILNNTKNLSDKKLMKRAGKLLSTDSDEEKLTMIEAIVADYKSDNPKMYIDYIDEVNVWEKVEFTFNSQEFLEEIKYL